MERVAATVGYNQGKRRASRKKLALRRWLDSLLRRTARINAKEALNDPETKPRFLMGAWGFVFLAYGIVWGAILIYWLTLKRRLRRAQTELAQLRASQESQENAQT